MSLSILLITYLYYLYYLLIILLILYYLARIALDGWRNGWFGGINNLKDFGIRSLMREQKQINTLKTPDPPLRLSKMLIQLQLHVKKKGTVN